MSHDPTFAPQSPLQPEAARAELLDEIQRFVTTACTGGWAQDTAAPALALRVTPGLGKTSTALRVIAANATELLSRGHVLYYAPTLELAAQAAEDILAIDPNLPVSVVRGRAALRPDESGRRMCERHELANAVAPFVHSVTEALCRRISEDGSFEEAACAKDCPYLAQRDMKGPRIHFLSHAYLPIMPPIDRDEHVALRVVDEKFWPALVRTSRIPLDAFMSSPNSKYPAGLRGGLLSAKTEILDALQSGEPLSSSLRAAGIQADLLKNLAAAEKSQRDKLEISPGDNDAAAKYRIDTFNRIGWIKSIKREAVFKNAVDAIDNGTNRLSFSETAALDSPSTVNIHSVEKLERDAPVLMLDADAIPDLITALVPGSEFRSLEAPQDAEVVQVTDRTLSNAWLLDDDQGGKRRKKVLDIVAREVSRPNESGVLLVATKSVLRQLHQDVGHANIQSDTTLSQPLLGAETRWFGPSSQGVNAYEKFSTIVIVGRLQPSPEVVEALARCIFGDDATPISGIDSGPLPEALAKRRIGDSEWEDAATRAHPDRRVQSVLEQLREAATMQAIARLRLVSPNQPKRVLILSSLPLPDLVVAKSTTFDALHQGLEDEPDPVAYTRLAKALAATPSAPIIGTRISAAGLAEDLPRDFISQSAAKEFRRGRSTESILDMINRIAQAQGWPVAKVDLTRNGKGGRSVPAIVFADANGALAAASSLWSDWTPQLA